MKQDELGNKIRKFRKNKRFCKKWEVSAQTCRHFQRRTRDSNSQLLTEHLISNEAASHSLILQKMIAAKAENHFCVEF